MKKLRLTRLAILTLVLALFCEAARPADPSPHLIYVEVYRRIYAQARHSLSREKLIHALQKWKEKDPFAPRTEAEPMNKAPLEVRDLDEALSLIDRGAMTRLSTTERARVIKEMQDHATALQMELERNERYEKRIDRKDQNPKKLKIPLKRVETQSSQPARASFDPVNQRIIAQDGDRLIILDGETGKPLFTRKGAQEFRRCAWMKGPGWVLGGIKKSGGVIGRWSGPSLRYDEWKISGLENFEIEDVLPSPDGMKAALTLSSQRPGRSGVEHRLVWIDSDGKIISPFNRIMAGSLEVSAYSRDGLTLATAIYEGKGRHYQIVVWDLAGPKPVRGPTIELPSKKLSIHRVAISPDGQRIFASAGAGYVYTWRKAGDQWIREQPFRLGADTVYGIVPIDPEGSGRRTLTFRWDGAVDLVDLTQGKWLSQVGILTRKGENIFRVSASPDGGTIVIGVNGSRTTPDYAAILRVEDLAKQGFFSEVEP